MPMQETDENFHPVKSLLSTQIDVKDMKTTIVCSLGTYFIDNMDEKIKNFSNFITRLLRDPTK
jgi:hypothetical protein